MELTHKRLLVVIVNYRTADLVLDGLHALAQDAAALPGLRADRRRQRLRRRLGRTTRRRHPRLLVGDAPSARGQPRLLGRQQRRDPPRPRRRRPAGLRAAPQPGYGRAPGSDFRVAAIHGSASEGGPCRRRLEDPDGTPQRSAFRFPTVLGELENGVRLGVISRLLSRYIVAPPVVDDPCRTDWLSGACMLVRREVFEAVGLLDEGYFLYFEEVDFCRRAARADWPCWYVPSARVVHRVGSEHRLERRRLRRPRYWFDSRRRYFRRHLGPRQGIARRLTLGGGVRHIPIAASAPGQAGHRPAALPRRLRSLQPSSAGMRHDRPSKLAFFCSRGL